MSQIDREYAIFNSILKPIIGEDLEIGRSYSSPLPDRGDSRPSFQVYPGDKNLDTGLDYSQVLWWKDWGYGKHMGHRPQHLLAHLNPGMTVEQAKEIIDNGDYPEMPVKITPRSEMTQNSSLILSKREWAYYNQYYIPRDLLKLYKVAGARQLYRNGELAYDHEVGPTTFIYRGPGEEFQVYRPKPKWFSRSAGKAFVIGYEQLPYKGKVCLILPGMKDGLCMRVATGWGFVSGSGELDYQSIGEILPELRKRFDYIGVCQDPDPAGEDGNNLFKKELKLPTFEFPYPNNKEDIADLQKKYGPAAMRRAFYNGTKLI